MESIGFSYKKYFSLCHVAVGIAVVAVRALVEICIDDILAVLKATDLRFQQSLVIWAGLIDLILRILKFWKL
jgi:hypothetical protein